MKRAVVVGAGFGGLAAAVELRAAGVQVTLCEAQAEVGGKAARLSSDGFTWDCGPTLLTLPEVFAPLFARAGRQLGECVRLHPLDPLCRYQFPDGSSFDHSADIAATAAAIAKLPGPESPLDAQAYPAFADETKRLFEELAPVYLDQPFEGPLSFMNRALRHRASLLLKGLPLETLDGLARRRFRTRPLRQFVRRFATYVGGDPLETSALFSLVHHVESRGDAVYPAGGVRAVAEALAEVARSLGVEIACGEGVVGVERQGTVFAVRTSERRLVADAVVLNLDPLSAAALTQPARLARQLAGPAPEARSLSAVALLFGLRGRTPGLALHNVFFDRDHAAEFEAIFRDRRVPDAPAFYVSAPTPLDPASAPAGHEALYVLVNAPARVDLDWPGEVARLTALCEARLEAFAPGFGARIAVRRALTPLDYRKTGSPDGALYGAAPHGWTSTLRRPLQRVVKGLYLAGGATHPGGGVPLCTLSGRHAAALALDDLGLGQGQPALATAAGLGLARSTP